MALPSEVGLRLLLCPVGSNIVVRTACCSVGLLLPVYSTFKAIEKKDHNEQQRWLIYWAAYGSFSAAEIFAEKVLSWFPLYYHVKFAFLVWLQLPTINGAGQLYASHLRPFLMKHQARLDQIVEFVYGEMSKFISTHQAKLQFAGTFLMKLLMKGYGDITFLSSIILDSVDVFVPANQMIRNIIPPIERQANRTIEGPKGRIQDLESEEED